MALVNGVVGASHKREKQPPRQRCENRPEASPLEMKVNMARWTGLLPAVDRGNKPDPANSHHQVLPGRSQLKK